MKGKESYVVSTIASVVGMVVNVVHICLVNVFK
jgi:hypothetical protein